LELYFALAESQDGYSMNTNLSMKCFGEGSTTKHVFKPYTTFDKSD